MAKKKKEDLSESPTLADDSVDAIIGSVLEDSRTLADETEGEESDPIDWFDTGCVLLNCQISGRWNGGVPDNKMFMPAGVEASGKSLIMKKIIADAVNRCGYKAIHFGTEGETTKSDFAAHGIPLDKVFVAKAPLETHKIGANSTKSVQIQQWHTVNIKNKWFDLINKFKPNPKVLLSLDSLSNLPGLEELLAAAEGKATEDMGRRNKQLKAFVRAIIDPASTKRIPIISIAHVYQSIGLYSTTEVSSGTGFKYGASIVPLFRPKPIKDGDEVTGIRVSSHIRKNRFAKPFTTIEFDIYFDGGIDRYSGLLEYAKKFGFLDIVAGGSKGNCIVLTTDPENKIPIRDFDGEARTQFWEKLLIEGFGDALNEEFRFRG
jgi:RecA/RadA recombinase